MAMDEYKHDALAIARKALQEDACGIAYSALHESLRTARREADQSLLAESLIILAENAIRFPERDDLNLWEQRIAWRKEAQEICTEIKDARGLIRCQILEATDPGADLDEKALLEQALASSRNISFVEGEVSALCALAVDEAIFGNRMQARSLNLQAINLVRRHSLDAMLISCLEQRALLLTEDGEECMAVFNELIAHCRNRRLYGRVVDNLSICAKVACSDDQLELQEHLLREALEIAVRINDLKRQQRTLDLLIGCCAHHANRERLDKLKEERDMLPPLD